MLKKIISTALVFSMTLALAVTAAPTAQAAAPAIKGKKSLMVGKTQKVFVKGNKKSTYKWVSKNKKVFTVSPITKSKTTIKGVGQGKVSLVCQFKAKGKGKAKRLSVKITVIQPVSSIKLSGDEKFKVGESTTLKMTASPASKYMTYSWSSSNTAVATVANGVVKGVKDGTATITCKSKNGVTGTFKVTIEKGLVLKEGYLYDMTSYNAADATATKDGYKCVKSLYSEYKYNYGSIWMIYASLYDGKKVDYRGKKIRITGYYMHTGKDAIKEVCLALNCTKPESYPILKQDNKVAPNVWKKVDHTFTLPKDAYNGDADDKGNNYSIYLYYAWKTANGDYAAGDDFYFRDYAIQVVS